jgi:hypothetical protein
MPGRRQGGVHHRDHRPLAVRAGDMDGTECTFRVPELGDQGAHVVEAELDAELFEPEQPVDRMGGVRIQ